MVTFDFGNIDCKNLHDKLKIAYYYVISSKLERGDLD